MEPIRTLFDHAVSPGEPILPSELRRYYDGDLRFSTALEGRPHVIGNFVSTLDGVVSYEIRDMRAVVRSADTMKLIASSWASCGLQRMR